MTVLAYGQTTFEITPSPACANGDSSQFDIVPKTYIENLSNNEAIFKWVRTKSIPVTWKAAVADPDNIYMYLVDSAEFGLQPGESGLLDVHFYPDGTCDSGHVKLFIFDINERQYGKTVTYNAGTCTYTHTVCDSTTTAVNDLDASLTAIMIFPNPNSGMFVVEIEVQAKTEFQIQLINITGQVIYSERVNVSSYKKDIDLSGHAKGVYALKVVSDGGVVTRKIVYE